MSDSPSTLARIGAAIRATGATLPLGDPRPTHGAEMEGWFWRVTDAPSGRVLVVLCGVNRHQGGDWATVALASHPGGVVRAGVLPCATASSREFLVEAGGGEEGSFRADEREVRLELGSDASASITLRRREPWPLWLGGGGIFSAMPWLGQYWHPHVLGGVADATVVTGADRWSVTGADVYAEKNWGAGFPDRWWWGQAQGFERRDVCVAFGGGLPRAGPISRAVGGVVLSVGPRVVRMTPPTALVRTSVDGDRWEVQARSLRQRIDIVGEAVGAPHVLPVPIPCERRNVFTDLEHLAGRLTVRASGRITFDGVSELAGLETGHRPSLD